jgi:hypothetical protein
MNEKGSNMYVTDNLRQLAPDIVTGRVSFDLGMTHVPGHEEERFLYTLHRLIGEERRKILPPERLAQLTVLDKAVSDALESIRGHARASSRAD